jgi:hypothetical protein
MIDVKSYGAAEHVEMSKCARCGCPCLCWCYLPPQPAGAYLGNYQSNAAASAYSFGSFAQHIHEVVG